MEKISVSDLAKKLNAKADELITKLHLISVEVNASSRLDELTVLKATLMFLDHPRVEDIAKVLNLTVDKVMQKMTNAGITVISHLSIVSQNDLIKLLKFKDLAETKLKEPARKKPKTKKGKKRKLTKHKRVFEVAQELGISEKHLLKLLQEMHVFATHRRSPLDEETIRAVKNTLAEMKSRKLALFKRFKNAYRSIALFASNTTSSRKIMGAVALICCTFLIASSAYTLVSALRFPSWKMTTLKMPQSQETYQLIKPIGLLEIHKERTKIPVAEQGGYIPNLTPTLTHLKKSPLPGNQGISVIIDSKGNTYEAFKNVVVGDIIIIRLANESRHYYKVTSGNELNAVVKLPLKSALHIKIKKQGQPLEIKAILQKSD